MVSQYPTLLIEAEVFGRFEELEEHKHVMDKLLRDISQIESEGKEGASCPQDSCEKQVTTLDKASNNRKQKVSRDQTSEESSSPFVN